MIGTAWKWLPCCKKIYHRSYKGGREEIKNGLPEMMEGVNEVGLL